MWGQEEHLWTMPDLENYTGVQPLGTIPIFLAFFYFILFNIDVEGVSLQ